MGLIAGKSGRLACGVLFAVGLAALLWWKYRTSPAEASYLRGMQLAAIQMYPEARDAYLESIKRDAAYAPPYRALAEMSASQQALQTSINYWKDYLSRAPRAKHARCRLALVELASGMESLALADSEEELQADANCAAAHLVAGALYAKKSEAKRALDHLEHAARAFPTDLRVQLEFARVLALVGEYDHAESVLNGIIQRDRSHAQPYYWLGYIRARRNPDTANRRRAEEFLWQAISLQPDYPEANYEMASLLMARHEAAKALPFAEKAVALRKHFPKGLYLLSQVYGGLNRSADAKRLQSIFQIENDLASREKALMRQFSADSKNVETALALAEVEMARDKADGALLFLHSAERISPEDSRVGAAITKAEKMEADESKSVVPKSDDSSIMSSIAEMATGQSGDKQ
jgi:tetratricopeptide (TPR) repeat protein